MKAQVTVDIPDGWELAEEQVRAPKRGEHYLDYYMEVIKAQANYRNTKYPILRKARWVPKEGEKYWVVEANRVGEYSFYKDNWDRVCIAQVNYFRTREAAERALERRNVLFKSIPEDER